MKEEKVVKEKFDLSEKELNTLTEKLEGMDTALRGLDDLRLETKGPKLFFGRVHPEFTTQFSGSRRRSKTNRIC